MPDGWKDWPRVSDAHLDWGVRKRQLVAHVRQGRLEPLECPDGTQRLDPSELTALYGPKGQFGGRDRNLSKEQRANRLAEEIDTSDPLAFMFRAVVQQLRDTHEVLLSLVRLMPDSLGVVVKAHEAQTGDLRARVRELEKGYDESLRLRDELADASQERDLMLKRNANAERRRDETLAMLKDQVPTIVRKYVEGDSFDAWVKRQPRDVAEALADSEAISAADAERIRAAAGLPPKAAPNQPNGVAS